MKPKKPYTIVIADDEAMIRNGLAENVPWLDLGFELLKACENGQEIIDLTRHHPIDAILADIRMPCLSGIDLARTVRRESPGTFVLFLTAHTDFEYAKEAIELGVWRFLVKPVDYAELLETLQQLYHEISQVRGLNESVSEDPLVQAVEDYVQCHYRSASLGEVAELLGLSQEHVSRVYYQRAGRHFSERLKDARMGEAARLLRHTKYRIAEISDIVGYSSPKNFARSFHQHFRASPRDFRLNTD